MTDSTPTPEEQIAALTAERDALLGERDALDACIAIQREVEAALEAERDAMQNKLTITQRELKRVDYEYANQMNEVERMRPVVDDYLRQAKNHERHREAGGILNMAEDTMVHTARAFHAAQQETTDVKTFDVAKAALTPIEEQHHGLPGESYPEPECFTDEILRERGSNSPAVTPATPSGTSHNPDGHIGVDNPERLCEQSFTGVVNIEDAVNCGEDCVGDDCHMTPRCEPRSVQRRIEIQSTSTTAECTCGSSAVHYGSCAITKAIKDAARCERVSRTPEVTNTVSGSPEVTPGECYHGVIEGMSCRECAIEAAIAKERARVRRIIEERIDALGSSEFHRASELDDLLAALDEGADDA